MFFFLVISYSVTHSSALPSFFACFKQTRLCCCCFKIFNFLVGRPTNVTKKHIHSICSYIVTHCIEEQINDFLHVSSTLCGRKKTTEIDEKNIASYIE